MIANVSPFINSFDDTYNTLKYADRAKHIKTNIKRNVLNGQYHITNYLNIIKNLQNRIFELENQISINKKRDFTASPKMNKKDLIENSFNNNSNNKKRLNRNSFIGFESENLRIIKEDEKEIKNNSLINFDKKNNSNNNSKIYINDKEDKELEMQYNSFINEFIISTAKEIKLKEKVTTLQQELFLLNNSIHLNEYNGLDTTELKYKAKNIKNLLHNTTKFLEEYSKRNEKEYSLLMEDEELKAIYKNYLISINNNIKIKTENIDMKLKLIEIKTLYNNLKAYINDIEEQIELRDYIISKNSEIYSKDNKEIFFKVLNKEQISKYKKLEQIKKKINSNLNIYLYNNNYNNANKKIDIIKKNKKRNENLYINTNENDSYSLINNQY
jgi:kinesin family protein 18/19